MNWKLKCTLTSLVETSYNWFIKSENNYLISLRKLHGVLCILSCEWSWLLPQTSGLLDGFLFHLSWQQKRSLWQSQIHSQFQGTKHPLMILYLLWNKLPLEPLHILLTITMYQCTVDCVSFPLLSPLIIAATKISSAVINAHSYEVWNVWVLIVVSIVVLFGLAGYALFDFIVEE